VILPQMSARLGLRQGLAISTVSQAMNANDLRSIDKELSQAELKLKIADLTSALADLKITLTEARSEATEKDDEIAGLKSFSGA
jgi:hypothetical protein